MTRLLHPLYGYPLAALAFLRASAQTLQLLRLDHLPLQTHTVPVDFLGVNVAPGDDPESDEYILARLRELGIGKVRMDYSYESPGGAAERLLRRLVAAGFDVMLDLLPPLGEAAALAEEPEARQRWHTFLTGVFAEFAGQVVCFEIGNTPNRGRWSGFSSRSFIAATQLAHEAARDFDVQLAGPNVSDFEPLYNAAYLDLLRRLDSVPDLHTDNLFVERVVEPEAYDHRVLGRPARDLLRLNLVKKARTLAAMGRAAGCEATLCTYTCWTIKRLRRRSAWPEQKREDYLVRYLALAAASGAMRQVYWGPLICSRDGLIDDAADDYPVVDQVSYYQRIRGSAAAFKPTRAYAALRYFARRLGGAHCLQLHHDPAGVTLGHYRDRDGAAFLLAWCRDAQAVMLDAVLDSAVLDTASFTNARGESMPRPAVVTEHPLYIDLAEGAEPQLCNYLQEGPLAGIAHFTDADWQTLPLTDGRWVGARLVPRDRQREELDRPDTLHPDRLGDYPELEVLRDVRNRLWNIADPRGLCDRVTVKLNRVSGFKQLTYRFRPSKGRRHWNNACQLLRRGIATPRPLAFYEAPQQPGIRDSWYLCEFIPGAYSAREVYAAFRNGETRFHGLDKQQWLDRIAGFVCNMHNKQVVHRDLSSGNLLIATGPSGEPQLQLIDIGRASIWSGPGSRVRNHHRMLDLIRIAYKLDWPDRERFITHYERHLGKSLSPLWRLPFWYYDSKQGLKKAIKGKRRRRTRR